MAGEPAAISKALLRYCDELVRQAKPATFLFDKYGTSGINYTNQPNLDGILHCEQLLAFVLPAMGPKGMKNKIKAVFLHAQRNWKTDP